MLHLLTSALAVAALACDEDHPHSKPADDSLQPFFDATGICPQRGQVNGADYVWSVPASGSGPLLLMFHGHGGKAMTWWQKPENFQFTEQASKDYVLASLSSHDRKEKKWNVHKIPLSNPDYKNVLALLQQLQSAGAVTAQTPIYLTGMSNGCGFTGLLSQLLRTDGNRPPAAQLMACCTGWDSLFSPEYTWSPTIFQAMRHDELINNTETAQHFSYLQGAGVRSEMWTIEPQPVDGDCLHNLCKMPGVPSSLPGQIKSALDAAGLLDESGMLPADLKAVEGAITAAIATIPGSADYGAWIKHELQHIHASHEFSSDHVDDVLRFFRTSISGGNVAVV